jgi:hypothetical protein
LTAGAEGLLGLGIEGRPLSGLALRAAAREGHAVVLEALLEACERLLIRLRRLTASAALGRGAGAARLQGIAEREIGKVGGF